MAVTRTSKIEESPLLNAPARKPPSAHSTINLDKLDKARFSEMKDMDSENSSLRIIIYVLIVIVIGVGLALLVRQLIANQQANPNTPSQNQNPVSSPTTETNPALDLSTIGISDTLATNIANNEDYVDSSILTLGDSTVDMTTAMLNKVKYTDYKTFSRLIFDLTTTETKLPKVDFAYDSTKLTLTVDINGLDNINENLMQDLTIGGLVDEIRFDKVNNNYIIFVSEKFKYRVFADKDNLVIDFKTVKELEKPVTAQPAPTPAPTPTPAPSTTPDASKPAAPHYTNSFTQDKQYVSSTVATNSISLNNYYVWDEGSFFEFSWAEEGKLGDAYIPNASAELVTEGGVNYIDVTIMNLKAANLANGVTSEQIAAAKGFNMAGANFVGVTRKSFDATTGTAVYRVELKKKANFQLLSQTTYDEKTQILSIQIKD